MTVPSERTVICDHGSGLLKCGFSGDTIPASVLASTVAYADDTRQVMAFGHDALRHSKQTEVRHPIQSSLIQNWEDMRALWHHVFINQLCVDPTACKILLTEAVMSSETSRKNMLEIMFECFGFQATSIQIQPVLTLLARGEMTGLAVSVGEGTTQVVPVLDGYPFLQHCRKTNIAGQEVTTHLLELLQRRGYNLSPTSDQHHIAALKERLCYVSCDYQQEVKLARETTVLNKTYMLPDGQNIRLGPERFMAPEVLFDPILANREQPGLAKLAFQSIQDMPIDSRMSLYRNVVLSGGCTMLPGLPTRLEKELRTMYLQHTLQGDEYGLRKLQLRIYDYEDRVNQVFVGAGVLASIMQDNPRFWITKEEWAEHPEQALRKCGAVPR